jgi:hypothetical protein
MDEVRKPILCVIHLRQNPIEPTRKMLSSMKFCDPKLLLQGATGSRSLSVIACVCQFSECGAKRGSLVEGWAQGLTTML